MMPPATVNHKHVPDGQWGGASTPKEKKKHSPRSYSTGKVEPIFVATECYSWIVALTRSGKKKLHSTKG